MGLRVILDYGIGSELKYYDGKHTAEVIVTGIFYGTGGTIHVQMKNKNTGKPFQRNGYELPKEFTLIKR